MKNKLYLGLLLIVFSTVQLQAQESPIKIIDAFFENYEKKGASDAVTKLYATNPWTSRIQDAIDNVKTQLERFNKDLVGEYHGYEQLTIKKLGDSYALYSYFLKFDRQFLRLIFQFYKPKDTWRLASFKFDDSFDEEIEEAAKLYYLDLKNK
jgi:hypothetical protein